MIEWGTYLAILVLGPGSVAVFVWFLFDLRTIFRSPPSDSSDAKTTEV